MKQASGVILWEGLSLIDRKTPIVCIATGLSGKGSANRKTGAMVQTYILRADVHPLESIATGTDGAICGGCVHRKNAKTGRRTCYVNVGQGPTSVWKAFKRGRYPLMAGADIGAAVAGKFVRFGTYGDPAAVPVDVWQALAETAGGYTGYTHQWRVKRFATLATLCQASCETAADVTAAHAAGFRGTFRVIPLGEDVPAQALHCPASEEQGKRVQCIDCRACDGSRDVVIMAHGPAKRFYSGRRALPVLQAA